MFQTRTILPFAIQSCHLPLLGSRRVGLEAEPGNSFQRTPWPVSGESTQHPNVEVKNWAGWHSGCMFPLLEYSAVFTAHDAAT